MKKQDRGFSIIIALGMLLIALFSYFYPIEYFKHIADAIIIPFFMLTILETIEHTKIAALSALSHESSKAKIHEMWLHRDYDMCKDDTDEISEKIKKDYKELLENIVKLDQSKIIIEKSSNFIKGFMF